MFDRLFKRRRFRIATILLVTTLLCSLIIVPGTVMADAPLQNSDGEEIEPPVGPSVDDDTTGIDTVMTVGQILDIGSHDYCYNYSGHTRGFWFTAPIDFMITAVRAPADCTTEVQNVAVVRMNSPLPSYPSSTNDFTVLGLWRNVAGTGWIDCNIPVKEGDIIGLLGARGTSIMHNSYLGTNTYATTLGGFPITLRRMGMQHNLNSTNPQNLWTEDLFVCRVEMRYVVDPLFTMVMELHTKVDALNMKVDEIQTTVTETNQTVEDIKTKVDALEAKIDALNVAVAQTSVDLQVVELKEKEQYLLSTTVLGVPVDAELLGVQASAMKVNQPLTFTSVPANASLAKTGVLEVTMELPKGLEDAQVFEFSVKYGANYGTVLFYK